MATLTSTMKTTPGAQSAGFSTPGYRAQGGDSMDRRSFIRGGAAMAGAAAAGTGVTVAEAAQSVLRGEPPRAVQRPLKLRVGTQRGASTTALAQEFVRHGVTHWCSSPRTS